MKKEDNPKTTFIKKIDQWTDDLLRGRKTINQVREEVGLVSLDNKLANEPITKVP